MPEDIVKYSGNTKITYHIMSEEEKIQELARLREKALHEERKSVVSARRVERDGRRVDRSEQGRAEGRAEVRNEMIEKMRKSGMTDEQIEKILSE